MMLLDLESKDIAVGISLLSYMYTWDYCIPYPTSGYIPPSLFTTNLTWASVHNSSNVSGPQNGGLRWTFADISVVSWDPSCIRSASRHFEVLWAWPMIILHLRHQKKRAWASLPNSEHSINKLFTLSKSGRYLRNKLHGHQHEKGATMLTDALHADDAAVSELSCSFSEHVRTDC